MKLNYSWAVAALLAVNLVSSVKGAAVSASAMNDYEMGSADSSLNEDPFGSPGTFNAIRLTFDNVLFKTNSSGLFDLKGFDVYAGGTFTNSPVRQSVSSTSLSSGALLIGITGPCTGFILPTAGNPVAPDTLTCAFSGPVDLQGVPQFVLPHEGSVGLIGRSNPNQPAEVIIVGANVAVTVTPTPEPSSVILSALGIAAMSLVWRFKRSSGARRNG